MTSPVHARDELRTLRWAVRCSVVLRRGVRSVPLERVVVPPRPDVPNAAKHLAMTYLRYIERNCLIRSLIRREWYVSQGMPRTIVIGVRGKGRDFVAHAWLDGDPASWYEGFDELARFPPRS
ncbi:MAG: lasso peptide biosynthesis B2 protein [Gaiellales bacterium]